MSDHVVVRAIVSGRVQGVGYRAWTVRQAAALGLEGWVRNLPDGTVELLASGAQRQVSALLEACLQGPPVADVSQVREVETAAAPAFPDGRPLSGFQEIR